MTLIKERLALDAVLTPGDKGRFDVKADGTTIATRGGNRITRSFGMGYPDLEGVVGALETRLKQGVSSGRQDSSG